MKLSLNLRNWGPQAERELMLECARAADASALDTLWLNDHVAVPAAAAARADPDFATGIQVDILATLAFLAGATERIGLGTAVLLLPYRPAFLTAKWVASIQALAGERLRLGVGTGWMPAEFRVLGVERRKRGVLTDESLALLRRCFESDELERNGERILFQPRPERPSIYVGGAPPHAFRRAILYGDGWIPAGVEPEVLATQIPELQKLAEEAGRDPLEVIAMKTLPLEDLPRAVDYAGKFAAVGVDHLVHTQRYDNAAEYRRNIDLLCERILPEIASSE